MSLSTTVFLVRAKLPSRDTWAAAIRARGFAMELGTDFDVDTHEGFLPCTYGGDEAGFEYCIQRVADYVAEQEVEANDMRRGVGGGRDTAISFVTRSDARGLATATIASSVLASIADGMVWNDEAGELFSAEGFLGYTRSVLKDVDAWLAKPKVTKKPEARPVAANIRARVVFRGSSLITIETLEAPARRFTVKTGSKRAAGDVVTILAVWEHPVGRATVHQLRIGATTFEVDPRGEPIDATAPQIAELIATLGVTESATRALITAGAPAVPALCEAARNKGVPVAKRRMAIVILGRICDAAAIATLSKLVDHPELGGSASQALSAMRR